MERNVINNRTMDIILLVLLVSVNVIIKSVYLTHNDIDIDEPTTILRAEASFPDFIHMLKYETNQPLFFVIMHFWIKVFGIGAVSLRFLPMLFGSLAVIFVYLIGRKYYSLWVALGASLLFTFSNLNIFHAHDARVYGIFVFLATSSMYFYFSLIDAENKRKYIIALTVVNVLMLYAHLCGIFIILIQALYSVIFKSNRTAIFKYHLVSLVIVFISFLPYVIFISSTAALSVNHVTTVVQQPGLSDMYIFLWLFSNSRENFILFITLIALFTLAIFFIRKHITIYDKMILGWFIIPYLVMFAISSKVHINVPRFMIYITPGFYLIIMVAANYLTRFNLKIIGAGLTVLCVSVMIHAADLKSSYNMKAVDAVAAIREHKSDSTLVYIAPPWISLAFSYHYNVSILKDYKNMNDKLNKEKIFMIKTAIDMDTTKFADVSDVLLLDGWDGLANADPQKTIYHALISRFERVDTIAKVTGYTVSRFYRKNGLP